MNAFLNASELMGVPKEFLAKASDVVEGKNRMRTVQTIFLLSLAAEKKKLRVPFLQHPYVFGMMWMVIGVGSMGCVKYKHCVFVVCVCMYVYI